MNVLRSIPGDDSGLLEELVLLVDREFIREREAGAEVTRTKWFTSSLEQMELVRRGGGVGKVWPRHRGQGGSSLHTF